MKLEVGMFYRYEGQIGKYKKITELDRYHSFTNNYLRVADNILLNNAKFSYNIIDILEVGDYVNGSEVLDFENKYIEEDDKFVPIGVVTENCYLENTDSWILEKDIKTIVTKEQFKSCEYEVGINEN